MSSTSSRDLSSTSATESLARRYRHLFVLPSGPRLLLYGAVASLALALVSRGTAGLLPSVLGFGVFVLSSAAISSALRVADRKSITNIRRISALLLAGELLWLLLGTLGAAYAWGAGSADPATDALVFGAFACAGLEFLILNGAFTRNPGFAALLAALHPAATLLIIRPTVVIGPVDPFPFVLGAVASVVVAGFPLYLRRTRTSMGYDSLNLFQAFMKTWTAGYADELEGIIADHSETIKVTTKVLRFRSDKGDVFLVLPGVHPGPFHPIGSYDLPGVVGRELNDLGPVMTLHKPGGHEHNLATRADTDSYAAEVRRLAQSITPTPEGAMIRGPLAAEVGKAKASATSFSGDTILTISFAPLGSDDLDTSVESELAKEAAESGLDLSVVDAHNSIDLVLEAPEIDDQGWRALFESLRRAPASRYRVAYSHSSELGFKGNGDLTENGVGLFMVQTGATKSVLVLADANNSVPTLRGVVAGALRSAGYGLVEFCTSDSHNLAARGMTVARGYEALGEATPPGEIADQVVKLAKLAEPRLSQADYGSAQSTTEVRVFGPKALNEFAGITQRTSAFARNYFRLASIAVAVLFLLSVAL